MEAFTNGMPVDLKLKKEIMSSCFIEDVKTFSPASSAYPYFSEFQALYIEVHALIDQQMKSKKRIGKKAAAILAPKMLRLVKYFDELARFLEIQLRETHQSIGAEKKKLALKTSSTEASQSKGKSKKKRSSKTHGDVMDELEQSMRELDELL
ncbi:MAG: hypothetical protein Q9N67_08150 [Ghiorsea sp.]|nr:hypothetical protein [Ghiorsea sp.]